MQKPRHIYEVTEIDVGPLEDRQGAIVLIDTAQPIDLALQLDRASLERLRDRLSDALSAMPPLTDR